jgi:menaquinone-dependent protoporphyrinogen IX oxidase
MAQRGAHLGSEQRGRILLVYAAAQHPMEVISEEIAERLRAHGFVVEIGNARSGGMPPPEDYDGVILGAPVGSGPETRLIATYIAHNRVGLAGVPAALFLVRSSGSHRDVDPSSLLEQFVDNVGWRPDLAAAFADRAGPGLKRFADEVATTVATAAVTAERTEPHVADR